MTMAIKLDGTKDTAKVKSMQSNATIDAMTAMFGEDEGWAILEKLNDYYRMKGWTK